MALSAKQIAMAWINSKFEPDHIKVDDEELIEIAGVDAKSEVLEKAKEMILEDLAKTKVRYQDYVDKYVLRKGVSTDA